MKEFTFNSSVFVDTRSRLPEFNENEVKNEPMLFSCNLKSARELGGPITHAFLNRIPINILTKSDFIVDSRVHMLMPLWYSSIPGFHHDDIPRSDKTGQPDYHNPAYHSQHVMGLINGDICPTKFALGTSSFNDIVDGEKYYKVWHPVVEEKIKNGELTSWSALSNYPIYFDCDTWHTGTPAVKNGWRWFIRCSWNTHRKPTNELRRQVQVYLEYPMEGW